MKKIALSIVALLISIASFAIAPIVGGTSTCVGGSSTLTDATPGGIWSSSNITVATIGATTGIVNGMAVGTTTITYTVGTAYVTTAFTVNPPTTVGGGSIVCVGSTLTLTGSPSGGSWTSGTPTLATVSSTGLVTGVAPGVVNIYYTGGGCYAYRMLTVNPMPSSITGTTIVGTFSTTTLSNATPGGTWSSSNTSIATVGSASGTATGVAAGTCNISYTVGGCYVYTTLTVTTSVSPIMGSSTVCVGSTITMTDATPGGSWSSSTPSVASIHPMTGVVTGMSAGTATLTYMVGTSFATRPITVNALPTIGGGSSVCIGATITLTGSPTGGIWSSSSTLVATVGSSTGVVTPVATGVVNITYTTTGCTGYKTVTVNGTPTITGGGSVCVGVTITLTGSITGGTWSSSSMTASVSSTGVVTGMSAGTANITYTTAGGCYAVKPITINPSPSISGLGFVCEGAIMTLSGTPAGGTWNSDSTWYATVDTAGNVMGMHGGTVRIRYTYGGCSSYMMVTVNPAPVISGPGSVCVGSTITLTATPPGGSWTSGSPSVATVSSTGLVTALAAGVINIYYTAFGCYSYKTISVNPIPSPIMGSTTITVGGITTLTCTTPGGTWSSSNPMVASIGSSTGIVTGMSLGSCNITYSVGGCYVYTYFTVATTTISPIMGSSTICVGSTTILTDATPGGTWSSGSPSIAMIHPITGLVTGLSAGTAIITYTVGMAYVTRSITIISSATITGSSTVCIGATITLTGSPAGGTWSNGGSFSGTIGSSSGIVTGLSTGIMTVTYSYAGCYAYKYVTVNAAPFISGPGTVCTGSSITLAASPTGGTWTSGSPGVATVGSTGIVTGVTAGVVNIYYTYGSCYSYKAVTVNSLPAIMGSTSVTVGGTSLLSDATPGGTWSSSNPMVATVGSSSGWVTGVSLGACNITYSYGGCYVYVYFTVSTTTISPIMGSTTICIGSTTTLTDASPGGIWSSSSPAVASVHPTTGVVTGMSAGSAIITYTVGSSYVTVLFTVLSSATITGSSTVCIGSTMTLSGSPAGGIWSNGGSFSGTIGSSSGVVTGLSTGIMTVTYTYGGCTAYKFVTVNAAPFISGSSTVCVGASITLAASPSGGSWTSGSPTVATVSSTGLVTGVTPGVVNIYYTYGGCYSYKAVTVSAMPTISGSSSICIGGPSVTMTGSPSGGTWSNGGSFNATIGSSTGIVTGLMTGPLTITYTPMGGCPAYKPVTVYGTPSITGSGPVCVLVTITLAGSPSGGVWSSSNPAIATVSGGIVTGVVAGSVNITYTSTGGCYAVKPVTVSPAPLPISGPSTVFPGATIMLTDPTPGGTWATDNPSVATVGPLTGIVTGVFFGTTNIHYWWGGCSVHKAITVTLFPETTNASTHTIPGISGSGRQGAENGNESPNGITVGAVRLYPNPTGGNVNIMWENLSTGTANIMVTDVAGREVYRSEINVPNATGETSMDLSALKDGIYMVSVKCGNVNYNGKIMIQR